MLSLVRTVQRVSFWFNDYVGSKILVGNAEIRIPFTAPKRVALISSNVFFSEVAIFADWGLAFSSTSYTRRLFDIDTAYKQKPIYSAGVSLRINLLNIYVIEPFYAFPFKNISEDDSKSEHFWYELLSSLVTLLIQKSYCTKKWTLSQSIFVQI